MESKTASSMSVGIVMEKVATVVQEAIIVGLEVMVVMVLMH